MLAALASIMIPAKEAGSIIAIMGDFNVHLDVLQGQGSETEDHNSSLLRAFMVGHEMVLKSTTAHTCDTGAMLDHVWVTGPHRRKVKVGVGESYWTDHRPVWCFIQDDVCKGSYR